MEPARRLEIGPKPAERRSHKRYELSQHIELQHGARRLSAVTEDISLSGTQFVVDGPSSIVVGDFVRCRFRLPHVTDPLVVVGQVRWVDAGPCKRVGVQFTQGLRPYHVWALLRARRRRRPTCG